MRVFPSMAVLVLALMLWARGVSAHDPGSSGGLFRSRDAGASWDTANPGRIVSAAMGLAISPTDTHHLLLATDTGLLRSRNGGRDWTLEAPAIPPVAFAVAFDADGRRALVSAGSDLFRTEDGLLWRKIAPPTGTTPTRAIVRGGTPGRVYLAGWKRFAQSDDWGASWSIAADGLPVGPVTALLVQPGPPETVYAVVEGRLWVRNEGAPAWRNLTEGMGAATVEALTLDPRSDVARMWAVAGGRMFRSDNAGEQWRPVGQPLPTPETAVRGIVANGRLILVTTDRGVFRSGDGGQTWEPMTENLPAHLEAGPLVRDPANPATLYAGFALVPYADLWGAAVASRGRGDQFGAGLAWPQVVLLVLGTFGAVFGVRWFVRASRRPGCVRGSPGYAPPDLGRLGRGSVKRMGRPLQEPLVQFLLLGAAFFLLNHWLGVDGGSVGRRIEMSPAQLARLTQAFTEQRGRAPTAAERKSLVDEYVREEILYREALEMGLDKGDVVVRRRLAQKMATILDDLEAPGDPTEEELRAFFDFHADRYHGPVRVRFTHVYFSVERRGASAETEARATLERLQAAQRLPQSAPERGDSFTPQLGDTLRSQAELAELFGQTFAEAVARFPAGVWQGPVRSKSGYHLVRVDERSVPPVPKLATIRDRLAADWRSARRAESGAAGLARIRNRYEVLIAEPPKSSAAAAEAGGTR